MPSGPFRQFVRFAIPPVLRRVFAGFLLPVGKRKSEGEGMRRAILDLPGRLWHFPEDRRRVREQFVNGTAVSMAIIWIFNFFDLDIVCSRLKMQIFSSLKVL